MDIDLDFTINLAKEEIVEAKVKISKRLADYMWQEGYSLNAEPRKHYALLSFSFAYINNASNRRLKSTSWIDAMFCLWNTRESKEMVLLKDSIFLR